MNETTGFNATSSAVMDITESLGVPTVLLIGVVLLAVYLHSRNMMTLVMVGGILTVFGFTFDVENIVIIPMLIAGLFVYNALLGNDMFTTRRRRRHHWDLSMDFLRSEHSVDSPSFITKIMIMLGLAHIKEIKKDES